MYRFPADSIPTPSSKLIVAMALLSGWTVGAAIARDLPGRDDILARALERARLYADGRVEAGFTSELLEVTEKLDASGKVGEREELVSQVEPLPGFPGYSTERLVTRNGRRLTPQEEQEEEKRRAKLIQDLQRGKPPDDSEQQRVVFDERLMARYDFELEGIVPDRERTSFVLRFQPKSGNLPEETRFDRALNKAEGEIWVDTETYEISKVHFRLREPIGIWWGMIGSIRALEGTVDRAPAEGGYWMPSRAEFYLNGRIFFMNLNRRNTKEWKSYRLAVQTADSARPGPR